LKQVDPHLLGRLIGKEGKALRQLKEDTDCRIIVADNGRVWIDGEFDGIVAVRDHLNAMSNDAKSIGVDV
tara:strand:- start:15 stop:224 length:210 start_codon:yes stop_codon:yes gene_type:complete